MVASLSPAFVTPLPAGSTESGEAGLVSLPVASQEMFAALLNTLLGVLESETASERAAVSSLQSSAGGEGIEQKGADTNQSEEETAGPGCLMALSLPLGVAPADPGPANLETSREAQPTVAVQAGSVTSSVPYPEPSAQPEPAPGAESRPGVADTGVRATEGAPPSARANEAQASDLGELRPSGPVTDRPPSRPAQPSFPAPELAFAARLTDRGTAQARHELLASLSSAPPTYALASQGPAAPESVPESGQTPDKPGSSALDPPQPAPAAASAGPQPQVSRAPFNPALQTTPQDSASEAPPGPRSMAQKSEEAPPPTPAEFMRVRAASGQRPPVEPAQDEGRVLRIASPLDHRVLSDASAAPATPNGRVQETSSRQSPLQSQPAAAGEPLRPQASQVKPEPLRELSLVVPGRQAEGRTQGSVEVRVLERAGEVRLSVRTPDTELASSLRQQLGDLVGRLEQTGYQTQTWRPTEVSPVSARHNDSRDYGDSSSTGQGSNSDPGGQPGSQHRRQQQDQPEWAQALAGADLQSVLAPWNSTRSVAHGFAN